MPKGRGIHGERSMRGFTQSDFPDYGTYIKHKSKLDRAQSTTDELLHAWDSLTGFTHRHVGMYWELQRLMHDAAQVGYEAAIGKPHRISDYDITEETIKYDPDKCRYCTHQYLVYGCEPECARLKAGLACELEVREFFG